MESTAPSTLVRGDILDYEALRDAMRGHDAISHQAAQLEITRSIGTPVFDLTTNTIGTLNVLKAAAELGITKVVEASSAGVYGQAVTEPAERERPHRPELGVRRQQARVREVRRDRLRTPPGPVGRQPPLRDRLRRARVVRPGAHAVPEARARRPVARRVRPRRPDPRLRVRGRHRELHRRCLEPDFAGHLVLNGSTGVGTTIVELANTVRSVSGWNRSSTTSPRARSDLAGGRMRLPSELQAMRMSYARPSRSSAGSRPFSSPTGSNASGSGCRRIRTGGTR